MDWRASFVFIVVIASKSFLLKTQTIQVSDGLRNGGNISINFSPVVHFTINSRVVNCWWNINNNRTSFFKNGSCYPGNSVTCSQNNSFVTSTFQAQPITKTFNVYVACNPQLKGSSGNLTLFAHYCQSYDHLKIIPVKDDEKFFKYNSKGRFQCPNNGIPVYKSGIKRVQPTVCLPNATWEGRDGLYCVNVLLFGNTVFNLTENITNSANFTCRLKGNPSNISGCKLKLQLDLEDVHGNFTVKPYHRGKYIKCILILKNETVVMSEKKLIEVYYGAENLNLTVVGSIGRSGNSYVVGQNSNVTFQCIADSNPQSNCTWYNPDLRMKFDQASPNCNWTTSFNSTANVSCHASNGIGQTAVQTIHIVPGYESMTLRQTIGISAGGIVFVVTLIVFAFMIHHRLKSVKKSEIDENRYNSLYASTEAGKSMDDPYGGVYMGEKQKTKSEIGEKGYTEDRKNMDDPYGGVYMGEKKKTKPEIGEKTYTKARKSMDDPYEGVYMGEKKKITSLTGDPFAAANYFLGS